MGNVALYALPFLFLPACNPANSAGDLPGSGEAEWPGGTCTSSAPRLAGALERIDHTLARRREAEAIPGLAVGVVCGSELAWARGYGVMALDDPRAITPETRFRIASITKVFTATAVMLLKEDGALALDDPVRVHLPWFEMRKGSGIGDAPVTIRHLLTHTAGLPRDSRLTDFGRRFQPGREQAIAALPSQRLQAPPGQTIAYSNLGYGVLGEVIAEASGMEYAEFLERALFGPLGMTRTLVHPTPDDDVAWGHGPRRRDGSRSKAGFWELGFATPAGGMASSVRDLGEFVILQLVPYLGTEPRILSPSALVEMHAVQHVVDPERGGSGLGWGVEVSNGQHLVYHGGELPEQTSFLLIDLRTRVGIIVLTNAQDTDANGMAQEILRLVRGAVLDPTVPFPARAIPPARP